MSDFARMLHALGRARARGDRVVLATLVSRKGSTYRRAGARALVVGSDVTGLLSGGCLEADVAEHAKIMLAEGARAKRIEYDLAADDADGPIGLGFGCKGSLGIVLEELDANVEGPMDWLSAHVEGDLPGAVAHLPLENGRVRRVWKIAGRTIVDGNIESADRARLEALCDDAINTRRTTEASRDASSEFGVLVEALAPATSLLLIGAGPDSLPIVDIATALGWRVTACDYRANALAHPRLAQAHRVHAPIADLAKTVSQLRARAALVMTHHLRADKEALRALTSAPVREYIGVLGPRARTQSILKELGHAEAQIPGFHAPAGLDLGGDGADAIALSIVSEIQASLHGRSGGSLTTKTGPIHGNS